MAYTSGSLPGGQLEIGVALVLQDRFSNQAREASSAIRGLHRDAKNAVQANLNAMQSYANTIGAAAGRVFDAMGRAVSEGAEFVDMMTTVGAISQATSSEMGSMSDIAQTLGLRTMFMSRDIASGMKYLAMAGNDATQIQQMISGAAMMANATGMELGGKGGTADLLTNIMRTFKMEGQAAATVIGDQMTKAAMSSNVSMTDLAESIKYSAASMVTLKQQLPQVAAMIGTLGNAGIQGSMAGTSIRNMADYLTRAIQQPNSQGYKTLAKLGLSKQDFVDQNGDLLDFALILGKIGEATKGLPSVDQNEIFKLVFGVRGKRAAVAIMRDTEGYFDLLDKIQNQSQGVAENIVGKRMDSIAGKIDIVRSAAENLRTTFTEALGQSSVIRVGLDIVAGTLSLIRDLFATPFGPWIAGLSAISLGLIYIGVQAVKLRTRWKILNGDSQVSFKTMARLLIGGWSQSTLAAQQYLNIERAIISQRKAGIVGGMAAIGGGVVARGGKVGGIMLSPRANRLRDASGRFVSKENAAKVLSRMTPTSLTRSVMGAGAAGATMAMVNSSKAIGRGILGFGAKLTGIFGGPVGLAITGISIFGPMIYRALTDSKSSSDENTQSVNSLAEQIKATRDGRQNQNPQALLNEMRWLVKALGHFAEQINNKDFKNHLTLNIDGTKSFDDVVNNKEANIRASLGIK